jgi:4-deoxy-L-threo-5-hexosulose-uronate ketol-isomerase
MEIRFQCSPKEVKEMGTEELRSNFLVSPLMKKDELCLVYSHYDRIILGGANPVSKTLQLTNEPELKAEYFLERRELGIINVGGEGTIEAGGNTYMLNKLDALYLAKGTRSVSFSAKNINQPPFFFLMSAPAHQVYPSRILTKAEASPLKMGESATANNRTIYKYIHKDGISSCQLVMGLTLLDEGSVWNTMPPHTHTRRSEVYFYFDLQHQHRVFHFMGKPDETRHILVSDHEAVISPPWSIHCGAGTANYGFIWAMAGENPDFTDMDSAPVAGLK